MFRLLRRACTYNYFKRPRSDQDFKALDAETDRLRVSSILGTIENALLDAENEQSGLRGRMEDVLARAAVTMGNGTDEYLERDALDTHHQNLFSIEISNGERRLKELTDTIAQFQSLKAIILSKFPQHRSSAPIK